MRVPFSDIPTEALVEKIETILHELGSLERLLADSGADMNMSLICQDLVILLEGIRSELQGKHPDTVLRIRSVIEQLKSITED